MAASYYKKVLNLKAEVDYYERGYRSATGYNKWMYGRRLGEYQSFLESLKQGIHEIILGVNGSKVCNCALIIPEQDEDNLWKFDGHVNIDGNETKVFYINVYSKDEDPKLILCCQTCQLQLSAEANEDGDPLAPPVHNCEKKEGN